MQTERMKASNDVDADFPAMSVPALNQQHPDVTGEGWSARSRNGFSDVPRSAPEILDSRAPTHSAFSRIEPWATLLGLDNLPECAFDKWGEHSIDVHFPRELDGGSGVDSSEGDNDDFAILQDVRRTRSGAKVFREEAMQEWLFRSVALFCRERGLRYAQGMCELAAPWALITTPPCLDAFSYRCFCRFVDRFAPVLFCTAPDGPMGTSERGGSATETGQDSLVVLEGHLTMFEQLLRYHDPTLAAHLERSSIAAHAYATPWFVTLFAQQTPIPILLHLWRRLLEYGDPVIHQFIALAWLLSNRRRILHTARDEVPAVVTRLRFPSKEAVDHVLREAVDLRRSTPRRFCDVLGKLCYEQPGDGGAATTISAARESAMTSKVCLLAGVKAADIVMTDAAQVAEIILAHTHLGCDEGTKATSHEGEMKDVGGVRTGGRFLFVDCRPGGQNRALPTVSRSESICGRPGPAVFHRSIDPTACGGRETAAVAALLHEFLGASEARKIDVVPRHPPDAPSALMWDGRGSAAEAGSDGSVSRLPETQPGSALPRCARTPSAAGVAIETHICFFGDGDRDAVSPVAAEGAALSAGEVADPRPAHTLAHAASRLCLVPHVCVLAGGFPTLEKALSALGRSPNEERDPGNSASAARPLGEVREHAACASKGGPGQGNGGLLGERENEVTEEGVRRVAVSATDGPSSAVDMSLAGTGFPPPSPPTIARARAHERKARRATGSRPVSAEFRIYAAKSADDMGSALRSLSTSAGRPLEDAARVCGSLGKGSAKTLGDARLSLSRSVRKLEGLDARMGLTLQGFARHFGAGLER